MRQYITAKQGQPVVQGGSAADVVTVSQRTLRIRLFLLVLLIVLSLFFIGALKDLSLKVVANAITVSVAFLLFLMINTTSRGLWSASSLYLFIFSLFHFGVTIVYGFGIPFSSHFVYTLNRWFYSSLTADALLLAFVGFLGTFLGIYVAFLVLGNREMKAANIDDATDRLLNKYFTIAGFILLSFGVMGWFILVLRQSGIGLLFGSYRDYLDTISEIRGIGQIYFSITLGLPLLAAVSSSRWQRLGFLLFALWSLVVLPLGLRGEVLFPLGAAVVLIVRKGYHLPLRRVALLLLVLLVIIAAVRQVRQVGLSAYSSADISLNPVDAVVEMGGSLRPVVEVVKWRAAGEDYIYGASYWAPVERIILRIVPGARRLDALDDDRLMNVLVQRRVGPIGFSPIAEAYRNFGSYGVFLVMFAVGVLLGWLDLWPVTPFWNAILAVIYVPLLIQIRNDFTSVPFQWLAGFLVVYGVFIVSMMAKKDSKQSHSISYG